MNTKHTPGPWFKEGGEISAFVDPENSPTYVAPICVLDTDWALEIAEANARLIAAAPELLAALRAARAIIQTDRAALADCHMDPATNRVDEDGQAGLDEYDAVLAQIDAAIAKATGSAA